jgi:FxsC-like protein
MASWVFFSYAREDKDEFLVKFYADLLKEISLVKTMAEDAIGFLDEGDIRIGDDWAGKLTEELRTCKVFLSICTPKYFEPKHKYCGKEFQICLDRQASSKKTSTAMVSVIWGEPAGSVHPRMKKFQYMHKSLPASYAEYGLRYIMKLGVFKDDYEQFITSLAKAIVDAGTKYPLPVPTALDPIERVKNAFGKAVKQAASAPDVQRNANFSYIVGSPDEICDIPKRLLRDLPSRYGPGGREWRPFYPEYEDTVGDVAMLETAMQKLFYKELPLENLLDRIKEAEAKKEIVVLLVDPWTIRVKTYRDLMKEYDRQNFLNCAVLVAWNSLLKTKRQRKEFEEEIAETFQFRANQYQKSVFYVDSISTEQDLRSTLATTLTELRNKMIQRSVQQQRIKEPRFSKKAQRQGIEYRRQPIVTGPGGRRG